MKSSFTHSGNIIIAGFGLMILMMSLLVYKTMQQNIDMVSEGDYYRQEINYQQKINGAANTRLLADSFSLQQKGTSVILTIPTSISNNLDSAKLVFYCNADDNQDQKMSLAPSATGVYEFHTATWQKTTYTLKADIYSNGEYYYQQQSIQLK
jgi:hypothetical protein